MNLIFENSIEYFSLKDGTLKIEYISLRCANKHIEQNSII